LPTELRLHVYELYFASLASGAIANVLELYHATSLLYMNDKVFCEAGSVLLKYKDELLKRLSRARCCRQIMLEDGARKTKMVVREVRFRLSGLRESIGSG
jgi:hypothetical protein